MHRERRMRANRTEYLFSVNTHTPPTMTVDSGEEFTVLCSFSPSPTPIGAAALIQPRPT